MNLIKEQDWLDNEVYTLEDKLRMALEIIAVGDSAFPKTFAVTVLVKTGIWEKTV